MPDTIQRQLALQDQHLHYLALGLHGPGRKWLSEHDSELAPELAARLAFQLKTEPSDAQLAASGTAHSAAWQGWLALYQGQFMQAEQQLALAWQTPGDVSDDAMLRCDIALGLGRLYTRSGHWQTARNWLLTGMRLARQHNRQFDIVRCYGALGELLLRAGHSRSAQLCLSAAYNLLPPGGGQRPRQLNYMASALMRNGDMYKAESLLMTSLFMAVDEGDHESLWHSLARLQILHLRKPECGHADARQALQSDLPAPVSVATAMYYLARAALLQKSDIAGARSALQTAINLTEAGFPVEHAWAKRALAALNGDRPGPMLPAALSRLQCIPAPAHTEVLHADIQVLSFSGHNGFSWLAPAPAGAVLTLQEFDAFFF